MAFVVLDFKIGSKKETNFWVEEQLMKGLQQNGNAHLKLLSLMRLSVSGERLEISQWKSGTVRCSNQVDFDIASKY
jgi:hypothetical protein